MLLILIDAAVVCDSYVWLVGVVVADGVAIRVTIMRTSCPDIVFDFSALQSLPTARRLWHVCSLLSSQFSHPLYLVLLKPK